MSSLMQAFRPDATALLKALAPLVDDAALGYIAETPCSFPSGSSANIARAPGVGEFTVRQTSSDDHYPRSKHAEGP